MNNEFIYYFSVRYIFLSIYSVIIINTLFDIYYLDLFICKKKKKKKCEKLLKDF